MTALDDYLAGPDLTDEERERFTVDSPDKAEWALRKLALIEVRQAENRTIADAELRRISDWLDNVNGTLEHDADFFRVHLGRWHRDQLAKQLADVGGRWDKVRYKSHNLPAGTIEARYQQPAPVYDEPDRTVEWLEGNGLGEYVATKKEVRRADLKGAIKAGVLAVVGTRLVHAGSGELLPGVHVEQVDDVLDHVTITIKPTTGGDQQ